MITNCGAFAPLSRLDRLIAVLEVVNRPKLTRRIADKATLEREVNAWQNDRNAKVVKVDWRFTTVDARIKLKHLYPVIHV